MTFMFNMRLVLRCVDTYYRDKGQGFQNDTGGQDKDKNDQNKRKPDQHDR